MKETISIDEFDGKKFKIRFVEENDNRKAVLTHYLHNYRNGVKSHFEKEATEYLNQIIEYKNQEENLSLVSDVALQQLLFEVEDVPFPTPENYTFKFIDLFAQQYLIFNIYSNIIIFSILYFGRGLGIHALRIAHGADPFRVACG